jgi:hypothetical protein
MEIFQKEIEDGLAQAIASQSSVAYLSPAVSAKKSFHLNERSVAHIVKAAELDNENQMDLFYLTSVLVSTGWNKNDDIFLAEEMWAARKTPEDKQFNYMHNEKDIIGHITGNYVVDYMGDLIPDDMDLADIPADFNIITNAVIYKTWSDKELRDRMRTIIEEIEQGGKWHVSMECLFPRFDYALQDSKGSMKLVNREESTAYLTKHLRAYGGSGEYDGYKLGRVLRNLSFSGKGLVTKPANPRSVILNEKSVSENIKEKQMDIEELKAKLAKAELELAEAAKMNEEMKKKMEQKKDEESKATLAQLEEYKTAIAEKDQTLASLQEQISKLSQELTDTKASFDALRTEKEATEAKYQDMQKKMKMEKRKAQLAEAGVEESDLEETLASVEALDDVGFDKIVAMMKKKMAKEKMKEVPAKASESAAEDILDDAVESNKTVASVINETEDDDASQKLRSSAAEWLGGCFSTLGKKTKK